MATKKKLLQAAAGTAAASGGAGGLDVSEVFSTYLYDGTGSTQTITNGIDLSGEGGLVWIKRRPQAGNHQLFDTERGVQKRLRTNTTAAESSDPSYLTAFNSSGFSVGSNSDINSTAESHASWTFRKAPKFFTCLTYTGTGSAQTISHNLGTTVGTIFVKCTTDTFPWTVFHRSLGATEVIVLNSTGASYTDSAPWNNTAPTDSVFTVGTDSGTNSSGQTYVAYLFAHNDGDGDFGPTGDQDIIKCGSISGSGGRAELGFEPQWVLLKETNYSGNWIIIDNMRGWVAGSNNDAHLYPNLTNAEADYSGPTFDATGFNYGQSGENWVYIAIRRGPMAVPTDATDVFDPVAFSGDGSSDRLISSGTGVVDFAIFSERNAGSGSGYIHGVVDRMRGTKELRSSATSAEFSSSSFPNFDSNEGLFVNNINIYNHASGSVVANMWKRAPSYFDVVTYTGTGATEAISHNLQAVPEMIWVKSRTSSDNWYVYHKDLGSNSSYLELNTTSAISTASTWAYSPETSVFYVDQSKTNASGQDYIAYLFASLDNVSKCGSYTGNGSSQTIDCGFSSGARFVLIKRTDDTADWIVYDTARGIVTGNEPHLYLNRTDAEVTNDLIDPDPSGFIIDSYFADWNASGGNYIFYAIA